MTLAEQLDALHTPKAQTPASRLLEALSLYDDGVALQRLSFARRYPDLDASALDGMVLAWLRREGDES